MTLFTDRREKRGLKVASCNIVIGKRAFTFLCEEKLGFGVLVKTRMKQKKWAERERKGNPFKSESCRRPVLSFIRLGLLFSFSDTKILVAIRERERERIGHRKWGEADRAASYHASRAQKKNGGNHTRPLICFSCGGGEGEGEGDRRRTGNVVIKRAKNFSPSFFSWDVYCSKERKRGRKEKEHACTPCSTHRSAFFSPPSLLLYFSFSSLLPSFFLSPRPNDTEKTWKEGGGGGGGQANTKTRPHLR